MAVNLSMLAGAGQQFFDNSGNPLSGGKLFSYAAGTTTPAATYTSSNGATAHTNPIILDASGRVPSGEIWLTDAVIYKFVLQTSTNVLIATYDNISGNGSGILSSLAASTGATLVGFVGFENQVGTVQDIGDADGAEWIGYTPYSNDAVAISIQDKLRQTVSVKDFGGTLPVMAQIQGVVGADANASIVLSGYRVPGDKGAGIFFWSPTANKTSHNGGTVIDPDQTFPTDWNNSTQVTAWYTPAASGTGCWIRQYDTGYLMAEWFGAQPWVIGGTQDSTLPFQQCANIAGRGGSWRWAGRHRITSYVEIPFKQTFGSFGQMTSVSVELFDPLNFQGVNTSVAAVADQVDSALFYDAATGEAFRCNEGAFASDFLLYGRGYSTTGMSLTPALPAVGSYVPVSGLRHGKYIRVENVTVILFRQAFDSTPWTTGGDYTGDYYSQFTNCEVAWCFTPFRTGGSLDTFNTKVVNPRIYANQFGDFGVATRNFQVVGGSVEGFNVATNLREFTNLSFVGTYFETFDTAFNGVVFNVLGITTLTFRDCLAYLNYVSVFVSSGGSGQGATVNYMTLNASGNAWWKTDATAGTVFSINTVPNTTGGLFGDLIRLSNVGSSLTYYTGSPVGTYSAPITIPV